MLDKNLKVFTYQLVDVNDKGYLTTIDVDIEAYTKDAAFDKLYELDNEEKIDYSKAKNTRTKYTDQYEDEITEWRLINERYKYPAHHQNEKSLLLPGDCIQIEFNIANFIDSLDEEELNYVKELIKERDNS